LLFKKNEIFAPHLKHPFQHIALLLLAIFTVTFVPFNVLHHHAEDEHVAIMHKHEINVTHHCELDDHFCQTDIDTDCGHRSHIQKTIDKCFACDFHFIKHFESTPSQISFIQTVKLVQYRIFVSEKLHSAIILLSNKGPPVLV
jgi:hypothetical protein